MIFKKKKDYVYKDPVEVRFDSMMALIKDLPKADYNRLKSAMDLSYEAYQKVKNVKTMEEKDTADISDSEKKLQEAVDGLLS